VDTIILIVLGLPLYFFFAWRFAAAWQSYREGIADQQNSPVTYLASNGIVFCVLAPVLIWFTQPWSLILHGFFAIMFWLGHLALVLVVQIQAVSEATPRSAVIVAVGVDHGRPAPALTAGCYKNAAM